MENKTPYFVKKTKDYSKFNTLHTNRRIDPKHVNTLKKSIEDNGVLLNPVLVNNKMQVIDGQHRFKACKELEKPIYYLCVGDYGIDEVQALNLNQKNWTKKDYAHSFAEMGYDDYQVLLDFYNEMEEFTFTSCIKLLQGTTSSKDIGRKRNYSDTKQVFEEGTWEIHDIEQAYNLVAFLRKIGEYYDGYNRAAFVNSIITLSKKSQFDKDEFLRKLEYQSNALSDCTKVGDYIELIEEIYNFKKRNKVNLRY